MCSVEAHSREVVHLIGMVGQSIGLEEPIRLALGFLQQIRRRLIVQEVLTWRISQDFLTNDNGVLLSEKTLVVVFVNGLAAGETVLLVVVVLGKVNLHQAVILPCEVRGDATKHAHLGCLSKISD